MALEGSSPSVTVWSGGRPKPVPDDREFQVIKGMTNNYTHSHSNLMGKLEPPISQT